MKILYSWLKDYVDFSQTPEQLADDLSMFAHEVESIQKIGDDAILDLEITPNRGDCLSVLGIARQIAAMYDVKLIIKNQELIIKSEKIDKNITVKISDPKICPRFTARIIDNINISPSSDLVQSRLKSVGIRPINNIVDATNYAVIETGQPLHAFDYDKIKDGLMNIRLSKNSEEIMTLDGKNHQLPDNTIIIEDNDKIYDLAGIMGGKKSDVDENTKTIVLQGAIFDPVLIRRASKSLHHQTEASYRYERGVDYNGTISGVDLASDLILKSCSDAIVGELIDIKSDSLEPIVIEYSDDKINNLLGTKIDHQKIVKFLERLYFSIDNNKATVPSFRVYDVNIWQDLAEEVARVYGYNNIERMNPEKAEAKANPEWQKREYIKDQLRNAYFSEIYSYSFAPKEKIELLGFNISDCVEIINPISPETKYLRPSLLPSLLSAVAKNPWAPEVNLFEIEKVFVNSDEKWQLGITSIDKDKNKISKALKDLGIVAEIKGIDQKILDIYKIRRQLQIAIIDIDKVNLTNGKIDYDISQNKYKTISKFPPTIFDLAFVIDTDVSSDDLEKAILESSIGILFSDKFDEFVSDKLGQNKKSIAFHIWIQGENGPVNDSDITKSRQNIIKIIEDKFNAKLRS